MKRILFISIAIFISIFSSARDMVITKLNQSPIWIGNRELNVGDTFSDADVIHWSSIKQDMKAKPKSGGISRHYSAAAFKSKSQQSISIKQYLQYLNKTNRPSTLDAGDLYMQKSENSDKFSEKRIALIIGNSLYGLLGRDLDCPISDAEDVTATLNELGFDTYTLYDATNEDFHSALMKFSNVASAEEYDVALFYFCGHGSQNDGKNFLLPSDAKNDTPEDISTWVSFDTVFESLSETACKTKLAFLDACRNTPRWQADNVASRLDQYDTKGSLVVYSTANNSVALGEQEEEARNTPFGAAFLESVLKPAENVSLTIKSISESVRERTEYYTRYGESPRQVYTFGVGDVDFSFVPDVGFETEYNKTKRYISESNPEMAIICLKKIKENLHFLDSESIQKYNESVIEVNELMLKGNAYLETIADIDDSHERMPENKFIIDRIDIDDSKQKFIFDYNSSNDIDTIIAGYNFVFNNELNIVAITQNDSLSCTKHDNLNNNQTGTNVIILNDSNELSFNRVYNLREWIKDYSIIGIDTVFIDAHIEEYDTMSGFPCIIKIISLIDGSTLSYITGDEHTRYSWRTPIAINHNGSIIVLKERRHYIEHLWMIDLETRKKRSLRSIYNNFDNAIYKGAFSSDDSLFFLCNLVTKQIFVYDTNSLELIHSFNYESIDYAYWNGNLLSIMINDNIYKWQLYYKSFIKTFNIQQKVAAVAMSANKEYIAAISSNGNLFVFNTKNNQTIIENNFIEFPDDIEFDLDNQGIWAISKLHQIKCYNLINNASELIYDGSEKTWPKYLPPNLRNCYIYFTNDHKYCVTSDFSKKDILNLFEVSSRKKIEYDADLFSKVFNKQDKDDEFWLEDEVTSVAFSLFGSIERIESSHDVSNETVELTVNKISRDNKYKIEGYSDGQIKVCTLNSSNTFIQQMIDSGI